MRPPMGRTAKGTVVDGISIWVSFHGATLPSEARAAYCAERSAAMRDLHGEFAAEEANDHATRAIT